MCPSDNREKDSFLGTMFADRYQIMSRLGKGGMAVVYKALDKNLGREVAVKVLRTDVAPDPVAAKRLIREARAAAQLHHPHIITMHDVGECGGKVFVVMEILVGKAMSEVMESEGAVSVERALGMCEQLASALIVAHAQGIIHRDIKPENLFLLDHGGTGDFVKVLDFSIAKLPTQMVTAALTRAGSVFGTPHYMAPEQVEGKQAAPQTDLYALGAVLFELIMGEPPYDGPSVIDILLKHVKQPPPHLAVTDQKLPAGLDELVQRLLAKKPQDRPESAIIVRESLARMLAELRGDAISGSFPSPASAGTPGQMPAPPPLPQQVAAQTLPMPVVSLPHARPPLPASMADAPTMAVPPISLAMRKDHPTVPDDLPDAPKTARPEAPPLPRKFASFGEDDDGEGRTMVGVGIGQQIQDMARARQAQMPPRALPAIGLPPNAQPPTAPPPIGPPAHAAPAQPPPPPGSRAPSALSSIEAPSAIHRSMQRQPRAGQSPVSGAHAAPSGPPGPPPSHPPAATPNSSTTPTHRAGSMPPVPPPGTVAPHLSKTGVDHHSARREPSSARPPSRAASSTDDRLPTQPSLNHTVVSTHSAPEAEVAGRKPALLWVAIPVGVIGLLGLATAIWMLTR